MGRTLHYAIYDDLQNYREAQREIRVAQELLIYRFTWTCEWPGLLLLDEHERCQRAGTSVLKSRPSLPLADGFTKVADDEWNAVIICRYAAWLSRRLPTALVALRDEGDYLTPGFQILRAGVVELDHERLAKQAEYLAEHGMGRYLHEQDKMIEMFKRGETHRSYTALEYADRGEIQALGFTPEELARMTLDEVADAIAFPWTTEGLGAA